MTSLLERAATTLETKYESEAGAITLTGVQALVRAPLTRAKLDRAQGLNTAGFISGYRGSPLGGYDMQLARAKKHLDPYGIVVRPAVNEDLGATAVWGSQQVNLYAGANRDGVFGLWYGKAPGVDRCGDVFKHANFAGTSPHGGVLAVAGDDHGAKSSTLMAQSEYAFADAEIPVLAPSSVQEVLTFAVKAYDLSRFAGLWVGMVTVAELMDSAATIVVDPADYRVVVPADVAIPPDGLHIRLRDTPAAKEARHRGFRLPAALAFARDNGFDKRLLDAPDARFGIVTGGKAYGDVRQALLDLGIDAETARALGIRLYKPGLVWPLEPAGVRAFAKGLREVLVVEERRDLIESQLKQILYDGPDRPVVVGKRDEKGRPLLPDASELDAARVARAIVSRIAPEARTPRMQAHIERLEAKSAPIASLHERKPYFCSGCPHNSSTVVPEGSRAMAGIGCHYMVQEMDRNTTTFSQMGGEGVSWLGQAPFTQEKHVFANLGDGTYFHSGSLAIRQSVAAGVNITYKILFNDAVAMTGGQPVDGQLTVPSLARQVAAEGVRTIVIVSDDPDRTRAQGAYAPDIAFYPRQELEAVQRRLRETPGVSVLIYDQVCATELRRRRKRGLAVDPGVRAFINERVCEGCGDCSKVSNCLSVEPVETEYGRKRRINQSSCNSDLSCVRGFCPSFVTVRGGKLQSAAARLDGLLGRMREVEPPAIGARSTNIVLAGIGGQGVTTLASVIGMAAHLDGAVARSVDMLGLAQKGGGVFVHVRLARSEEETPNARVGLGQADLVLANDIVVTHGPDVAPLIDPTRSAVVLNATFAPTAASVSKPELTVDHAGMRARLDAAAREVTALDAGRLAMSALGDEMFANMILFGVAWQKGLVPLSLGAIDRALELNGAALEKNRRAFAMGRLYADDPKALEALAPVATPLSDVFEDVLARRAAELVAYQDEAYAERYRATLAPLIAAEERLRPGARDLSRLAAESLFKLMAYKDEYEVARLYADPAFAEKVRAQFGPDAKLQVHLAPPALGAHKDGRAPQKRAFGGWVLRLMPLLAKLKGLRGGAFDPFGQTEERKLERALRDEFIASIGALAAGLSEQTLETSRALLAAPQQIRGYGHVKLAAIERYRAEVARLKGG